MRKIFLPLFLLLWGMAVQAQYTEIINSNRPGGSQGAFAVGRDVIQLEIGPHYGQDSHALTGFKTETFGIDYALRYGVLTEALEISWRGNYIMTTQRYIYGGRERTVKISNFKTNAIGIKYLLYDPMREHYFDEPNVFSWKASHSPKWWMLIPAVSIYAGVNFTFGDRPVGYPFFGDKIGKVSPKIALITQNNVGPFVFVMNFIADRLTDDHKRYLGIFTLTHAVNRHLSFFAEYQFIKDDFYSDDLLHFGGAYLLNPNLQVDVSGMVNFKDTPSRWKVGVGASYRLDMHSINERVYKDRSTIKEREKTQLKDGKPVKEEQEQTLLKKPDKRSKRK